MLTEWSLTSRAIFEVECGYSILVDPLAYLDTDRHRLSFATRYQTACQSAIIRGSRVKPHYLVVRDSARPLRAFSGTMSVLP